MSEMPEGLDERERKEWTRLHLPGLLNVQPCEVWPWAEKVADLRAELAEAKSHWKADVQCKEIEVEEAKEVCREYIAKLAEKEETFALAYAEHCFVVKALEKKEGEASGVIPLFLSWATARANNSPCDFPVGGGSVFR